MSYFSASTYTTLSGNPSYITSLWSAYGAAFKNDLQRLNGSSANPIISGSPFANISNKQAQMAFATLMAFEIKPYGSSTAAGLTGFLKRATTTGNTTNGNAVISNVASLTNIDVGMWATGPGIPLGTLVQSIDPVNLTVTLNHNATASGTGVSVLFETPLSCAQQSQLALEFFNILDSTSANNCKKLSDGSANPSYNSANPVVTAWGWNGNAAAVGNHAQIIIYDPAATEPYLLCDATCGLFAVVSPDTLCNAAAALPAKNIVDFWTIFDIARQNAAGISGFLAQVKAAITNFKYRLSDIIYNQQGLENFQSIVAADWRSPQYWNL